MNGGYKENICGEMRENREMERGKMKEEAWKEKKGKDKERVYT